MGFFKPRTPATPGDAGTTGQKHSLAGPLMAWGLLGRPRWTPRRYDWLAEEGYARNVVAFRCIREIAQSAASVPLLLFQGESEQTAHPVLELLARPNPQQGKVAFLETLVTQLLLPDTNVNEWINFEEQ